MHLKVIFVHHVAIVERTHFEIAHIEVLRNRIPDNVNDDTPNCNNRCSVSYRKGGAPKGQISHPKNPQNKKFIYYNSACVCVCVVRHTEHAH